MHSRFIRYRGERNCDNDRAMVHEPPNVWLFFKRALKLRCPECGVSALFTPVNEIKTLKQWYEPLQGCPRCGYAYERESGYFLLSIWAFNYGVVGAIGLALAFTIDSYFHPPLWKLLCYLMVLPVLNFMFMRHSKAFFLAMDHFFDPHLK
jgi:uncharacterized protein (DUF983 family)